MMTKKGAITFLYGAIAVLLLLCLFDMPYGFYILVRFITTLAFCFFAFYAKQSEVRARMFLFIILALLFQPFLKLSLGRTIWNIIDVIVAFYLFYLIIVDSGWSNRFFQSTNGHKQIKK